MFVRRIAAASVALVVLGAGSSSYGQSDTSLHGVGTVSLAYTDNMFGSPSDPAEGQPGPIDVWMVDVAPGIRLIRETPTSLQSLTYSHPFTFYLGHSDAMQQSDVGLWAGIFQLSPRDELILGATAWRSDTRVAAVRFMPNQTTMDPQATGKNVMLQASATEAFNHELTSQWRLMQRSEIGTVLPLLVPTPQTHRYHALLGGGPEFRTARNAYGVDAEAIYYFTTAVHEDGVDYDPTAQIIVGGTFRWRHDITYTWSTELRAGAAAAMRTDPFRGGVWGPVWLGAIRYANEGYETALTVRRTLGPNLVTATTIMADDVHLGAGMPISREQHIVFHVGAGFAHTRAIRVEKGGFLAVPPFATPASTESARLVTTYNTLALDASVGWYPEDLPYFELRGQRMQQAGIDNQIAPAATFRRHLAMLSMGFMWPARDVPPVPAREPGRVDNADRDMRVPGGTPEGGSR